MTTTITRWTAECSICRNSMTGEDTVEPGMNPVRQSGHDNPVFTFVTDIPGGAHEGQPAEDTIRIVETCTR